MSLSAFSSFWLKCILLLLPFGGLDGEMKGLSLRNSTPIIVQNGSFITKFGDEKLPYLPSKDSYFQKQIDINNILHNQPIVVNITVVFDESGKCHKANVAWWRSGTKTKSGKFESQTGKCRYKFFENAPVTFRATDSIYISEDITLDPNILVEKGLKEFNLNLVLKAPQKSTEMVPKIKSKPETVLKKMDKKKENETLKIEENIIIHNIFFEKGKSILTKESYSEAAKLANLLRSNPSMKISIEGHTDNIGEKAALQKLSTDRAVAIKRILTVKGIASMRITTKGYGDAQPLAPNDSETNKSKNRRVEIKVLN